MVIKERKIQARTGSWDWIKVPSDWHKAKGVLARRTETNDSFATRDYSVKCETGSEPLIVVEGYWVWWCKSHHQLYHRCESEKFQENNPDVLRRERVRGFRSFVKIINQFPAEYKLELKKMIDEKIQQR